MGRPHALVVPYPAQGHVIPLLELSYCLVDHGFKITFVNSEFNHARVIAAVSSEQSLADQIHLVSVSDGLAPGEDRNDLWKLTEALKKSMPVLLEELILKSNEAGEDKITCLVVDGGLPFVLEVARKTDLRVAEFWPTAAALVATVVDVPKLIEDGIIDEDGVPLRQVLFQLAPGLPLMNAAHLSWNTIGDRETQKKIFHHVVETNQLRQISEFVICNSFQGIELPVFTYAPKIRPIGPLLTGERLGKPVGHFWPEDATCEAWLDEQPANSVVYVAFGSFTIFDNRQFQELALGLELCNRPFLWVVRPDLTDATVHAYPPGFMERVASRGRVVSWAPQTKVLAHPSIACFVSHCGWNSTLEGVRNGVPFLCWPYFADQFLNQSYICDVWRIGLNMTPDEDGIISKEQIKSKVEELLVDKEMKERVQLLKGMARNSVKEGGNSYENLKSIANAMKAF